MSGRRYRPWNDAELQLAERMAREFRPAGDITAALHAAGFTDRTKTGVRLMLERRGWNPTHLSAVMTPATVRPVAAYRPPDGPTLAEAFAPAESAEEPDDVFMARMLASADRSLAKARAQKVARLRIAARGAVCVSLSSDWHVAAEGTDLRGLIEYADYIGHTPGIYALAVGDMTDNAIKHRGGSVRGVLDELRFLDGLVGRFRGKLLGMTSGNHDDWSRVFAGVDNLLHLSKRHRIHYAPDELLWQVDIVNPDDLDDVTASYHVYTRHQWRRGSALNPCHACWTWWQEEGANWPVIPDVLAIGHNHIAAKEERSYEHRTMHAVRMGAWQHDSSHSRAIGFARYRSTAPTIVLPAQRAIDTVRVFTDPHAAVRYAGALEQDAGGRAAA